MSVAQAQASLTHREAVQWAAYFRKRGLASASGALVPHIQQGFALLASILVNVHGGYQGGGKAKIEDFLPRDAAPDENAEPASPETVAALLSSLWSGKNRA